MILHSFDESEFELTLLRGRQWNPHATNWEDYDWVNVQLRGQTPFGTFRDAGPYFLNRELLELASWFSDIAQSKVVPKICQCIENHPLFTLAEQEERFVTLRLLFTTDYGWNFVKEIPPQFDIFDFDFPYVDIETSRNQLQQAAQELRIEHARLPRHWR